MLCLGELAWNSRHVELEDIVDGAASLLTGKLGRTITKRNMDMYLTASRKA